MRAFRTFLDFYLILKVFLVFRNVPPLIVLALRDESDQGLKRKQTFYHMILNFIQDLFKKCIIKLENKFNLILIFFKINKYFRNDKIFCKYAYYL